MSRLGQLLDTPDSGEKTVALLELTAECEPLREALARQILARVTAPSSKAEKALVRAARQTLMKETSKSAAPG